MPVQNLNLSMMTEPVTAGADVRVFPVSALSKKWSKFPRYNMKCIEEIEILHVILDHWKIHYLWDSVCRINVNTNQTYTVALASAVTGSVFMRRLQLTVGQCS